MFMPVTDPAISLPQAIEITKKQNAAILAVPEVAWVVAKIARAETSTDPAPVNMTETVVQLKPEAPVAARDDAREAHRRAGRATTLPGVSNIWTQPIINRINMLTTGIRSEVGVKVFGDDLRVLEERARAVADVLRRIPGAADVYPEQVTGAPYLDIRVNREAAARYGITVGAIQDVIETAVGETNLMLTIEGRQRFPVRVRYAPQYRATPEALGSLLVAAPNGAPGAARATRDDPPVTRSRHDLERERAPRRRRCCSTSAAATWGASSRRPAGSSRRRSRCPRAPTSSGAGSTRTRSGRAQRLQIVVPVVLARHLPPALHDVRLVPRGGARAPGGALRAWRAGSISSTRSATTSRSRSGSGSSRSSAPRSRRQW